MLRSGRHVSQILLLHLCRTHPRSARRFEFVRLLRPSACSLRFFLRRNGIVRPQQTLSIQMPQRSGIWGDRSYQAVMHLRTLQNSAADARFFKKNDLTTFFANVTCAAIGDRIVSVQRRGGSLGGSIRLTIFHSSFPSFPFQPGLQYVLCGVRMPESKRSRAPIIQRRSSPRAVPFLRCPRWIRI